MDGKSPLHKAMLHGCFESFEYLVSTRYDNSIIDGRGYTVWHILAAGAPCERFEWLTGISGDLEKRQGDINCDMETTIRVAVRNQNYHLACQLLGLCKSRECFVGSPSIYEIALRGGDGAAELIEALFLHGVLREEGQFYIHKIQPDFCSNRLSDIAGSENYWNA